MRWPFGIGKALLQLLLATIICVTLYIASGGKF